MNWDPVRGQHGGGKRASSKVNRLRILLV
ncbi:unnamed protein product [Ectocarpus sp. CCAP 1310/34]|nr:unnamed protein product [Ectocarpus sp. CCAP 1310/34]